ncbi:hypothetical protein SVIRM249S_05564 [Streptomyces viridochromogenes]
MWSAGRARTETRGRGLRVPERVRRGRERARRAGAAGRGREVPRVLGQSASFRTWSRTREQQRLIRRETCIWEMPSCSAMWLWVMSPKKRM